MMVSDDPSAAAVQRIKKQFADTIVFFRLGDFYETFNDDAKTASSVCSIVLTGREMGTGNRVPLAGVPYHAVDKYLAKLIQARHKVAIVEQTGTPEKVEGVPGRVLETREVAPVAQVRPILATGFSAILFPRRLCGVSFAGREKAPVAGISPWMMAGCWSNTCPTKRAEENHKALCGSSIFAK